MVFLPKPKPLGTTAQLGDVRPICVGPTIYRLWASIRVKQVQDLLLPHLPPDQTGCAGSGVHDLWLEMEFDYEATQWPYAVTMDLSKAFDATNFDICLQLLQRAGVPQKILTLLCAEWTYHR